MRPRPSFPPGWKRIAPHRKFLAGDASVFQGLTRLFDLLVLGVARLFLLAQRGVELGDRLARDAHAAFDLDAPRE